MDDALVRAAIRTQYFLDLPSPLPPTEPEEEERVLVQGCSLASPEGLREDGQFALTHSMLIAYNAMRSGAHGVQIGHKREGEAPLLSCLGEQEENMNGFEPRILGDITDSVEERTTRLDNDDMRQTVFHYNRPPGIKHLAVPAVTPDPSDRDAGAQGPPRRVAEQHDPYRRVCDPHGSYYRVPEQQGPYGRAAKQNGQYVWVPQQHGPYNQVAEQPGPYGRVTDQHGPYVWAPQQHDPYYRLAEKQAPYGQVLEQQYPSYQITHREEQLGAGRHPEYEHGYDSMTNNDLYIQAAEHKGPFGRGWVPESRHSSSWVANQGPVAENENLYQQAPEAKSLFHPYPGNVEQQSYRHPRGHVMYRQPYHEDENQTTYQASDYVLIQNQPQFHGNEQPSEHQKATSWKQTQVQVNPLLLQEFGGSVDFMDESQSGYSQQSESSTDESDSTSAGEERLETWSTIAEKDNSELDDRDWLGEDDDSFSDEMYGDEAGSHVDSGSRGQPPPERIRLGKLRPSPFKKTKEFNHKSFAIRYQKMMGTMPYSPPPGTIDMNPLFDDGQVSDEEGDRNSGRISPCTFAHWAKGCFFHSFEKPCESGRKPEVSKDEPRMRRMKPSRMAAAETIDGDFFPVTNQFDKVTGDEISPKYSVPAVPAMMWDAPGIDPGKARFEKVNTHVAFERMDPVAARPVRSARYGKIEVPSTPPASSGDEYYTEAEVNAAVRSYEGSLLSGITGTQAASFIEKSYEEIAELKAEEEKIRAAVYDLNCKVDELEAARAKAEHAAVFILSSQQEAEEEDRNPDRRLAREKRIRRHVAEHIRELRCQTEIWNTTVSARKTKRDELETSAKRLEAEIQSICESVGRSSFKELMADKRECELEEKRNSFTDEWLVNMVGFEDMPCGPDLDDGDDPAYYEEYENTSDSEY